MITKERAEEISRLYYDKVFRYCMSMSKSNYHDAQEITQEVFLVFTKKLNTLNDDIIEHWLMSVAKKKALEHAGVKKEDVTDLEIDLDRDGDILKYEIDFRHGNIEYDYDINAITGEIISADKDRK